jgi:hypothetical protein
LSHSANCGLSRNIAGARSPPGPSLAAGGVGSKLGRERSYPIDVTAASPHKLSIGGKGLGRFTWLKAFKHARIERLVAATTDEPSRNLL